MGPGRKPHVPASISPPQRRLVRRRVVGALRADGMSFAVVVSRFNEFITKRLEASAVDTLERLGAERVAVIEVPGAFELAVAARTAAASGRFQALVCLGLILRGDTPHFDFIAHETARGIGQSALESGVPHAFGVLTCETLEEAIQRAGLKAGNKGAEAALAAVEMANLFAQLRLEFAQGRFAPDPKIAV